MTTIHLNNELRRKKEVMKMKSKKSEKGSIVDSDVITIIEFIVGIYRRNAKVYLFINIFHY